MNILVLSPVPSMSVQNFQAINLTSENSITLSWDRIPRDHINGILVGYVIRYQQTSSADEEVTSGDIHTRYIGPGARNIVFHGIPQYSVWRFQISAITRAGEGFPSNFTYGGLLNHSHCHNMSIHENVLEM